jgi:hypothetical protein
MSQSVKINTFRLTLNVARKKRAVNPTTTTIVHTHNVAIALLLCNNLLFLSSLLHVLSEP